MLRARAHRHHWPPQKENDVANDNTLPPPPTGDLGFSDLEAAINMRDWLKRTLEGAGAQITGSGMGFGAGDLWFKLEGHEYMASIKPVNG